MISMYLREGLPFVQIDVGYRRKRQTVPHILIDTGSAGSILNADRAAVLGILPAPDDDLRVVRGVGGTEAVFSRVVDYIQVGEFRLAKFELEIGAMNYGFDILGILGMDFRQRTKATVDLDALVLSLSC